MLWDHLIMHFICFPLPGFVRKSGMMKIVHEKYKSTKKYVDPVISEFQASFESAIDYNKELDNLLNKAQVYRKKCFLLSLYSLMHYHHHHQCLMSLSSWFSLSHLYHVPLSHCYHCGHHSLAIINNCRHLPLIPSVIIISQYHGCCRHYIASTPINMNSPPLSCTTNFVIITTTAINTIT